MEISWARLLTMAEVVLLALVAYLVGVLGQIISALVVNKLAKKLFKEKTND